MNLTLSRSDSMTEFFKSLRSLTKFHKNSNCVKVRKVIAVGMVPEDSRTSGTAYYVIWLNFWVRNETRCVPSCYGRYHHKYGVKPQSQGPDLNWSVVDLQSTAWPLRHLGSRVR